MVVVLAAVHGKGEGAVVIECKQHIHILSLVVVDCYVAGGCFILIVYCCCGGADGWQKEGGGRIRINTREHANVSDRLCPTRGSSSTFLLTHGGLGDATGGVGDIGSNFAWMVLV